MLVSQSPDYMYTQREKSVNQSVFELWGEGEWKEEKSEGREEVMGEKVSFNAAGLWGLSKPTTVCTLCSDKTGRRTTFPSKYAGILLPLQLLNNFLMFSCLALPCIWLISFAYLVSIFPLKPQIIECVSSIYSTYVMCTTYSWLFLLFPGNSPETCFCFRKDMRSWGVKT